MVLESHNRPTEYKLDASDRLIVALDNPDPELSLQLVRNLGSAVSFYKVGWRSFLTGGMEMVRTIHGMEKHVFLDLKMNDIEETIESAVRAIKDQVRFLTIFGNAATAGAAARGRGDAEYPKLLTVTLLSSQDEKDLINEGSQGNPGELLGAYVQNRATLALAAGCDGLIASGSSIKLLRDTIGSGPLIVSPGIRMANAPLDDHKRSATPREAIASGSDYLVVGRPIWAAPDPAEAARAITLEIQQGLADRG